MSGRAPLRRNRDFVLLQAGQLLSAFGPAMSQIAYPLLALALTRPAAKTGHVGAAGFAPMVLLSAAAGVAADRFGRRLLMIASDAAGAVAVGVLAVAVLAHDASFWLILVVAFADSAASVVFRAGNSGAFKAVVPQPQLADAASNLAAAGVPIAVIVLAHRRGLSGAAIGGLVAAEGAAVPAGIEQHRLAKAQTSADRARRPQTNDSHRTRPEPQPA